MEINQFINTISVNTFVYTNEINWKARHKMPLEKQFKFIDRSSLEHNKTVNCYTYITKNTFEAFNKYFDILD